MSKTSIPKPLDERADELINSLLNLKKKMSDFKAGNLPLFEFLRAYEDTLNKMRELRKLVPGVRDIEPLLWHEPED